MIMSISAPGFDLEKTLKSGQVFRYRQAGPDHYEIHAKDRVALVWQEDDFICVEDSCEEHKGDWTHYFGGLGNLQELQTAMSSNRVMREAFEFSRGIGFLRQDPFECLISFIISQRNNIPRIQMCVEKLCETYGAQLPDGSYAFPEPCMITESRVSTIGLGYRAPYVVNAAEQVDWGKLDLEALSVENSTFEYTMQALTNLYGVGPKVANCVALFGLGFTNAFPVDVHIERVLALPEMHGFNPKDYGNLAGYIQQYLFNWALYNGY